MAEKKPTTKTTSKKLEPVKDFDLDDAMPDDDELKTEVDDSDEDESTPDVVVTQPSTANSEPITLETASCLMDLVEHVVVSDDQTLPILVVLGLKGKGVFWKGVQVAAIAKQEDGLFTVWKARGSIPGKAREDVDGAESFELGEPKGRIDFPIGWKALGNGCFRAYVLAFAGQLDYGPDFVISTNVEQMAEVNVITNQHTTFESVEFAHYGKAASWTAAVAQWFEKIRQSLSSADDGE